MTRFVLATANPDKVTEIRQILGAGVELVRRPEEAGEVEENGDTLAENARIKANALVQATGLPAIADDTGLEVEALDGRPGVFSARYAGEPGCAKENVAKLLSELRAQPGASRRARFRTVALARWPDGDELVAEGEVSGTIAPEPRGSGGFGYDPVFVPDESDGRTFAELSPDEKNAISHRGRAFRLLAEMIDGHH